MNVQGKDWDIFDIDVEGKLRMVQADDEAGTMTDDEAIIAAREAGHVVDERGFVLNAQ